MRVRTCARRCACACMCPCPSRPVSCFRVPGPGPGPGPCAPVCLSLRVRVFMQTCTRAGCFASVSVLRLDRRIQRPLAIETWPFNGVWNPRLSGTPSLVPCVERIQPTSLQSFPYQDLPGPELLGAPLVPNNASSPPAKETLTRG